MTVINVALVCDGTSDLCLLDIIQWITDTAFPQQAFRLIPAKEVIPAHTALHTRLHKAYLAYNPDIIICHRDAEAMSPLDRSNEVIAARNLSNLPIAVVSAIPVRMIESWLLTDESAIRCAADNRNGTMRLNLPSHKKIESLPDPKEVLISALKTACNLPPQRLRKFDPHRARSRVASFIDNFEVLRNLASFNTFETDLIQKINVLQAKT